MFSPRAGLQENALGSADDASDSDLELALDDLDPASSTAPHSTTRSTANTYDFRTRIPLRNLRPGRRRKFSETSEDGTADTQGLLRDTRTSRSSADLEHGEKSVALRTGRKSSLAKIKDLLFSDVHKADAGDEPEDEHDPSTNRTIVVGRRQPTKFPANAVSNSRYTAYDFIPRTLFNEFKFFINLYFLFVALSQIIPALRIGYRSSYIVPLAAVLTITLGKEAFDDVTRRKRDAEANSEPFTILHIGSPQQHAKASKRRLKGKTRAQPNGRLNSHADEPSGTEVRELTKSSKDLRVGDIVKLSKNQRVPADLVILKAVTSDIELSVDNDLTMDDDDTSSGEAFIRTDQLDGETDWKLRLACPLTQQLPLQDLLKLQIIAGKPDRKVNEFLGTMEMPETESGDLSTAETKAAPLSVDNTAWANTVIASTGTIYGCVIYTGSQTRQAMSLTQSRPKVGLLELEINNLTKILCALTFSVSLLLVVLGRIEYSKDRPWYTGTLRFLILFSTVIPISLRVNLDMGKLVYARYIEKDEEIAGTIVRTSTIPEDLGRIEYLLSDKTEMELKKIHIGTVSYANDAMDEVVAYTRLAFGRPTAENSRSAALLTPASAMSIPPTAATRARREIGIRVKDLVLALAVCHNVTPILEEAEDGTVMTSYQASSPDEIAIVKWAEAVGLRLKHRDRQSMTLQSTESEDIVVRARILNTFPFTSEGKRMGIILGFDSGADHSVAGVTDSTEIWFYQKGADTVMSSIVLPNDWLDEETSNMAREGLRTLVVGRKRLSVAQYYDFANQYARASLALQARDAAMSEVVRTHLESSLELLGVTGVEDKLQKDVKTSLELLRNAGIKIWMLTGDKIETARCIAVSSKLVARGQNVLTIARVKRKDVALDLLQTLSNDSSSALLIDGESVAVMLRYLPKEFVSIAARLPAVIACRVSPIQKADLANLIKSHSGKRICCIGDGGNDVSMIQAADVGVGIVGKEGRQASLAADFSVDQFRYLTKLLVWHGRNSYKRSAKLAQFVIHRGVIISVCQVVFSIAGRFEPNALYRDWLMVGYATLYTFAPVFSLVLDRDVDEPLSTLYPELYAELKLGRSLSYRSFFIWLAVSIYQGCIIQGLSQLLVSSSLTTNFLRMVAVSYTALVMNELMMVAVEITTWHWIMAVVIFLTVVTYIGSIPFLGQYIDLAFVPSTGFVWRVAVVLAFSVGPVFAVKFINRRVRPPTYRKVMHV